jgi:hypothetical protein
MTIKFCPACGVPVPFIKGVTPEYVQFNCPTHGLFEVHERIANHLIDPRFKPQMMDLSKYILNERQSGKTGLLIITKSPRVNEVQRKRPAQFRL